MKKYALPLAMASVFALQACNPQPPGADDGAAGSASAPSALETPEQRLSYGIGYQLGQRMVADKVPLETAAFSQGVSDAVGGGEQRLTAEEIQAEMQSFQEKAMAEHQAEVEAAATANAAASAAYLKENAAREGVVVTESGLQYEVLVAGEGAKPGAEDMVEVHYRGTLVDGSEFDSSYSRGQPATFRVNQVIPGWTEALQLMSVGSKWKLVIPSELAYGDAGAGQVIGPNAALVFEVELLSLPSDEAPAAKEGAKEGAEG